MDPSRNNKKVINSSKRSTYDPRKAKDAERKKSYAIRKRYKKLKEKVGEIKVGSKIQTYFWYIFLILSYIILVADI
jgi:hypothetical protein